MKTKIMEYARRMDFLWSALSPFLIQKMFILWFLPEVINPVTTTQKVLWFIMAVFIIVWSYAAIYYRINKEFRNAR